MSLSAGLALACVGSAGAVGFRLPNQDPEGIARGNAFVATADNPAAIYYNPAGITQLEGHQLSFGSYLISTGIDYTTLAGHPFGAGLTASPDSTPQLVPQVHYVYSPAESDWSFGVGLYAPFGLGIEWGSNTPFATAAEEAVMLYASFNPVVAYQVNDCLSVAAGLTINYSDVEFQNAVPPNFGGGHFRYEGDDASLGFTLGVLYQPTDQWSFGASYRSAGKMNYEGKSRVGNPGTYQPTSISVDFPQYIDLGVSYRPTENWNFEFNIDWTDWDSVNTSVFKGTAFGDVPLPFLYESSFMYEFGVTRQLGNGYWVSAGYIFSENSVPDFTLTPLNADSDLHLGSVGFGRRGDAWSWALGYHFAYNGGRTVSGNLNPTVDGRYETLNHAVNLSVRRSF